MIRTASTGAGSLQGLKAPTLRVRGFAPFNMELNLKVLKGESSRVDNLRS